MSDTDLRLLERNTSLEDAREVRRLWATRARVGLGFHGEDLPAGMHCDRVEELHPDVRRDPAMPHGLVGVYTMDLKTGGQIEMVYVPGGVFTYGSREDDSEAFADEKPQGTQAVPGFYLSRGPVSEGQFRPTPPTPGETVAPPKAAVNLSWHDATAWATENGLALPSEMQWEKAARGTDGRKFAWGDVNDGERMNCAAKVLTPIGTYPRGASPYGCLDLNGGVWEWCADVYSERRSLQRRTAARVLRGGSWIFGLRACRAAYRNGYDPGRLYDRFGFRVGR